MPVKSKRSHAKLSAEPVAKPRGWAIAEFLERRSRLLAIALVVLASVRIVATYPVFNHTWDENAHIACGMEWLADGVYRWEAQHPPLARVAAALLPYLAGARPQGTPRRDAFSMSNEGSAILYSLHHYQWTLALARLGILPFFWIACLTIYVWGKRYFGRTVAVCSLLLFSFLPTVLAHAGLATTDMALTALLGAAFLRGAIWLELPTLRNAIWFGCVCALAFLSKFSFLVYFPATAGLCLVWYLAMNRPRLSWLGTALRRRLPGLGLAILIALPIIWAGYRFSFGSPPGAHYKIPAPEIVAGVRQVIEHNRSGHPSYLFGKLSTNGFVALYPIALMVKTPLGILLLAAIGLFVAFRLHAKYPYAPYAILFSAAILIVGMMGNINIGLRHVLPVYYGMALVGGIGLTWLLKRGPHSRRSAWAAAVLVAWLGISSLAAHPDYIPYFNELAGSHPEDILADSDLDWCQDYNRLGKRLRELGATSVTFHSLLVGDLEKEHGFPHLETSMDLMIPNPGWNAVSMADWKIYRFGLLNRHPNYKLWPDRYQPVEKVGKTILLYYFPPAAAQ